MTMLRLATLLGLCLASASAYARERSTVYLRVDLANDRVTVVDAPVLGLRATPDVVVPARHTAEVTWRYNDKSVSRALFSDARIQLVPELRIHGYTGGTLRLVARVRGKRAHQVTLYERETFFDSVTVTVEAVGRDTVELSAVFVVLD